jgi:predicted aconitase with swiveling domain
LEPIPGVRGGGVGSGVVCRVVRGGRELGELVGALDDRVLLVQAREVALAEEPAVIEFGAEEVRRAELGRRGEPVGVAVVVVW